MKYAEELMKSMEWLGEKPDTLFLGQAIEYPGTAMTNSLVNIEKSKLLEMPVNEDMQMGISLGLALNGSVPISIYPRWNFLLLAENQGLKLAGSPTTYTNNSSKTTKVGNKSQQRTLAARDLLDYPAFVESTIG